MYKMWLTPEKPYNIVKLEDEMRERFGAMFLGIRVRWRWNKKRLVVQFAQQWYPMDFEIAQEVMKAHSCEEPRIDCDTTARDSSAS